MDVIAIDDQSALQIPPRSQYRIVQDAVSTILELRGLELRGKRHVLPPTLRTISERSIFRTAELPADVSAEATLGLSRYLLDIGFLARVE